MKLILAIILLLIALLVLFRAPAYPFWLLAILVGEFPLAPACLTIVLIATGYSSQRWPFFAITCTTLLLFLTPIIHSWRIGSSLENNLNFSFGPTAPQMPGRDESPFSFRRMFSKFKTVNPRQLFYTEERDRNSQLDFYPSGISGYRPCILVIHGGSWKSGNNKQLPELNTLLSKQGYHVAAINYALAPAFQYPAPVQAVREAIAYLKANAVSLHIDPTRFVLLGRSAGAQIALMSAYTLHDPAIRGVIDFYGPGDMVWGYSIPSNPLVMNSRKVMEDYLGGTYQTHRSNFEASSPVLHVTAQSPPTLLIHGKNDALVAYEHSRRLNTRLGTERVNHYLLTLPWATHGFDYNINGPGGQLSTYAVTHFIGSVTNSKSKHYNHKLHL
jgi:acetyl esterase/lipase